MNSYDAIAELYDDDMGRNNSGADIDFFRDHARRTQGRVLELGCGTGRITLPLVKDGHHVVGVDISSRMLDVLERKARQSLSDGERTRLVVANANMRDFTSDEQFSLILCPFCAFNYLVSQDDQVALLNNTRANLAAEGLFIVDSFVPKYEILSQPDPLESFDYERTLGDGTIVRRYKTITQDRTAQINEIRRSYELYDRAHRLKDTVRMQTRIRYMFKAEMEYFLRCHGFAIVSIYGDYEYAPYSYDAEKMVFVMRKAVP